MTDNIQKLYEIAEAPKCGCKDKVTGIPCTYGSEKWEKCNAEGMACPKEIWETAEPSFTAKKQLELIKFISNTDVFGNFHCYIVSARWSVDYGKWAVGVGGCDVCHEQFEQALAGLVLEMWDGIPVDQKQEIKRILQ